MKMRSVKYILFVFLFTIVKLSIAQTVRVIEQGKPCSIRGMSVVSDKIAWVSGSNGYFAVTVDGGKTWQWQQVQGYEKSDFRDIHAFSDKEAVIMSSGTPALVMFTVDGGNNWEVAYHNDDKAVFLDNMDFADTKNGLIVGDPVAGKFLMLQTADGGRTWQTKDGPEANAGEAAFAASGSGLVMLKANGECNFVTGGTVSRLVFGHEGAWRSLPLPIAQAADSKGAFALTFGNGYEVFVGGDYKHPAKRDSTVSYIAVKESTYKRQLSQIPPGGFQSGICWLGFDSFLSTGTSGSNVTIDGGANWRLISKESFNVCKKSPEGKLILLAGDKGKIGICKNYFPHN
ncbi:WD40/YVTN/BNR-like repeat-containing protein [Mucilaginibacter sp. KACC 22063]|uniref:WD40/YVTN/BNR-like repeat-containing protein n=1 Tax=Mucilaginibacter sp. KACC 22063 TaxID=3025666 RepID=UPI0023673E8F|nr:YCF48-related protein [Mucilaginibacter sp. KACC 22063]WDF54726.1 YCF48-related protein [Mucilaginibacter sp. KACC 22063]